MVKNRGKPYRPPVEVVVERKEWEFYVDYLYAFLDEIVPTLWVNGVEVVRVKIEIKEVEEIGMMPHIYLYCKKPKNMSVREAIELEDRFSKKSSYEWEQTLPKHIFIDLSMTLLFFEWINIPEEDICIAYDKLIEDIEKELGEELDEY